MKLVDLVDGLLADFWNILVLKRHLVGSCITDHYTSDMVGFHGLRGHLGEFHGPRQLAVDGCGIPGDLLFIHAVFVHRDLAINIARLGYRLSGRVQAGIAVRQDNVDLVGLKRLALRLVHGKTRRSQVIYRFRRRMLDMNRRTGPDRADSCLPCILGHHCNKQRVAEQRVRRHNRRVTGQLFLHQKSQPIDLVLSRWFQHVSTSPLNNPPLSPLASLPFTLFDRNDPQRPTPYDLRNLD